MCNMLSCMHNMNVQQACATSSMHNPKAKVYKSDHKGISIHDFEVAKKRSLFGNKCKEQMGEPIPTCQGPMGMLHQISRLCTQVWQFPKVVSRNRLGS